MKNAGGGKGVVKPKMEKKERRWWCRMWRRSLGFEEELFRLWRFKWVQVSRCVGDVLYRGGGGSGGKGMSELG